MICLSKCNISHTAQSKYAIVNTSLVSSTCSCRFTWEVNVTAIIYRRIKHGSFHSLCIRDNHGTVLELFIISVSVVYKYNITLMSRMQTFPSLLQQCFLVIDFWFLIYLYMVCLNSCTSMDINCLNWFSETFDSQKCVVHKYAHAGYLVAIFYSRCSAQYGYIIRLYSIVIQYGYIVWLYSTVIQYSYIVWVYSMGIQYGYIVWLYSMAIYYGYIICVYSIVIQYGYIIWLYSTVIQYGYTVSVSASHCFTNVYFFSYM